MRTFSALGAEELAAGVEFGSLRISGRPSARGLGIELRWGPHPTELRTLDLTPGHPISLAPRLPDRVLLIELERPVVVLSASKASIELRIPLCVALSAGNVVLAEAPTARLRPTWLGPNPGDGTLAWLLAEPITPTASRCAEATLILENTGPTPIALARAPLPCPRLGLWVGPEDRLRAATSVLRFEGGLAHDLEPQSAREPPIVPPRGGLALEPAWLDTLLVPMRTS